jgi:transcriptional regulator with XRE-family HTH domain
MDGEGQWLPKKSQIRLTSTSAAGVRMRRLMLDMSQEKLADGLGLTFQQGQKYEKGTNRIGASRLEHISRILQVPVAFFFEGVADSTSVSRSDVRSLADMNEFVTSSDGLRLVAAFTRIENAHLRRRIVDLVEEIADHPTAARA